MIPRSIQTLPADDEEHLARQCLGGLVGFPSDVFIILKTKNNGFSYINNASLG